MTHSSTSHAFCLTLHRLLERKNIPAFRKCFETKGIEEGLSARPSCRFEIFTQKIKVQSPRSLVERNDNVKVASTSSSSGISGVEVEVEVVLDIAHNEDAMIALVSKFKGRYPDRAVR